MVYDELVKKAANLIENSNFLIALTGSGISAESGIPTFRGKDGLWKKYRPEQLATLEAFRLDPVRVWEWYNWRIEKVLNAKPNPGHTALAELERKGILKALITQNVDDLHERAGSKNVIKLHGNILEAKCIRCNFKTRISEPFKEIPPKCPNCGNLLRPNVVWFGEPLPQDALSKAYEMLEKADGILVIGTSALVMPAGAFPSHVKHRGGFVVEINLDETHVSMIADVSIRGKAGEVLPLIVNYIKEG
ncbi:MAG: NAD-dependent protein deacetylase [Candidatus Njordarchaeia archaeon]